MISDKLAPENESSKIKKLQKTAADQTSSYFSK
jgi:hypothetical protein